MITTHVLDTATGTPAVGMTVILEVHQADRWHEVGRGSTNASGRLTTLNAAVALPGTYRLTFETGQYHRDRGIAVPFFPEVNVTFTIRDGAEHCHVPLLLSPYGYSTYRGA